MRKFQEAVYPFFLLTLKPWNVTALWMILSLPLIFLSAAWTSEHQSAYSSSRGLSLKLEPYSKSHHMTSQIEGEFICGYPLIAKCWFLKLISSKISLPHPDPVLRIRTRGITHAKQVLAYNLPEAKGDPVVHSRAKPFPQEVFHQCLLAPDSLPQWLKDIKRVWFFPP